MYKLKKIASLFASALTIGSTFGVAMAANYPSPFVSGGSADVAVVYGAAGANTDLVAATDINADLTGRLITTSTGGSGGTTTTVEGEAYPLFTGSSPLYINDSINSVRSILTDDELPTVLAESSISGNVDADITQKITVLSNPRIIFAKQPDSSENDPTLGIDLSGTSATAPLMNVSFTFDRAINFSHTDTHGESFDLLGQQFTVGSDSSASEIVLFQASETVILSSASNPSQTVTVDTDEDGIAEEYTLELISASDTSATLKVTDSSGSTKTQEIDESDSKKVLGIEIAIENADESEALGAVTATLLIGSDRLTLQDGSEVLRGADETAIEGTYVEIVGGPTATTEIAIAFFADDSDTDAIVQGTPFEDPVFAAIKVDLNSFNIPMDSEDDREMLNIAGSGDDALTLEMTPKHGNAQKVGWFYNSSTSDLADDDGDIIVVREGVNLVEDNYVVVGNEEDGYLLKLQNVNNATTGYTSDKITFEDVYGDDTIDASLTSEGAGTLSVGGLSYGVWYNDTTVRLDYPDSSGAAIVAYPTIQTSLGANVGFYEPLSIDLNSYDGAGTDVTSIMIPDGDGYTSFSSITGYTAGGNRFWNVTNPAGTVTTVNMSLGGTVTGTVGKFTYNMTFAAVDGGNTTILYVKNLDSAAVVNEPALLVFEEEEDDGNTFGALIVDVSGTGSSSDPAEVQTIQSSWNQWGFITLESDDNLQHKVDLFGTLITLDSSDDDQKVATISYPDEQVQAMVYIAETEAAFSEDGPSGPSSGVPVVISDAEAAASTKNLIVVGGSCVNTMAAQLLGSTTPLCGDGFTTSTGVSSGSFLIETFARSGGKVATLVAGYNAGDTTNAATALRTQTVDTTVGKKYTGSTSTSITAAAMEDTA